MIKEIVIKYGIRFAQTWAEGALKDAKSAKAKLLYNYLKPFQETLNKVIAKIELENPGIDSPYDSVEKISF